MSDLVRYHIHVSGIVQGVGFRPFVYGLARRCSLAGWVYNTSSGVFIEIEGTAAACTAFLASLQKEAPSLSRIDRINTRQISVLGEKNFIIKESVGGKKDTLISPDMGICEACLADIKNKEDRRYGYAFTNCTNCGPRFTIIKDLPYDRKLTTMSTFPMCAECAKEFTDPLDRRFHAQPNACPVCGPRLRYTDMRGGPIEGEPLPLAQDHLRAGKILAVKGIGGYHLVCDAADNDAVKRLRSRKLRWDKPFAVMLPDMAAVRRYCQCSRQEEALLISQRRPIVLLRKRPDVSALAEEIAPGNPRLGVMLPYTPLHYLLIEGFAALVMTSANISDEPIVYKDDEVYTRLSGIADFCLTHDREIFRRCDDSVMTCVGDKPVFFRRSRGYAPEPLPFCGEEVSILALGAQQKNTFCLTRKDQAFLSQHIGDLDNMATMADYRNEINDFRVMFDCSPQLFVHDLHPQYASTVFAQKEFAGMPRLAVQHHFAHFASVLAEHRIEGKAIGLIYDGTGYGTDGTLWGGEVLVGDINGYARKAHLRYAPLPGGEKAIREPWRMAMSLLAETYGYQNVEKYAPDGLLRAGWQHLLKASQAGVNAPKTSGMGRLFDGIAALMGLGRTVNYEGQAAVLLEEIIDNAVGSGYHIIVKRYDLDTVLDWRPLVEEVIEDMRSQAPLGVISGRFHRAVADASVDICLMLREETGLDRVVLSGGCWQNAFLLENTTRSLEKQGFHVYFNQQVPINDGGISYGQAAIGAAAIRRGEINVPGDTG